ncbi:helix-turn-helix transcriptional regulator [Nonomuraea sp. NPDC050790]|uniref:helix-turn-helix transcriptional regulator n=1 Tax=Nonomuraea sp. NPDC050790 TaxID=3364371 RepID=UPI0037A926A0
MKGTSAPSRTSKSRATAAQVSLQVNAPLAADRSNDRLLTFPEEVCELTRMEAATWRYKRHRGEAPFLFRMGRRLYAWRSDVVAWIEAQRLADQADA